jgi:transcriptional regulator with XRE-family HTH domain
VETKNIFAKNLKTFREAKNLTQGDLAEKIGVHSSFVSKMEAAKHFPDPEKIDLLGKVLGVNPTSFFISGEMKAQIQAGSYNPEAYLRKLEQAYELLIKEKDLRNEELSGDKKNLNDQVRSLMTILSELSMSFRTLNKS